MTSELENSRDLASTMCGISAEGLTDVTVTLVEGGIDIPGGGKADVQGTAKPGKGDAGPVTTDPTKAVVCTGVVSYLLIRSLDESDENKAWRLDSVKLWEVKTPGVKWTRPSSHHHH